MTVRQALQWGTARLKHAGVGSSALDAELLLARILKNDRVWLYAHPEQHVSRTTGQHFSKLIQRRVKREPVAYILGHKEFYGLDFYVNRQVLIPRPETEILLEAAISEIKNKKSKIKNVSVVDVGTGSGAIAVAARLKIKDKKLKIIATDVYAAALKVARKNARRHGVERQITFLCGNLIAPIKAELCHGQSSALTIVANLPYLPTAEWRKTAPEIKKWEPREALDGGKDGLKYYREMFRQLECKIKNAKCKIIVFAEICPEQTVLFKKMAHGYFPSAEFRVAKDLSRRARVVIVNVGE